MDFSLKTFIFCIQFDQTRLPYRSLPIIPYARLILKASNSLTSWIVPILGYQHGNYVSTFCVKSAGLVNYMKQAILNHNELAFLKKQNFNYGRDVHRQSSVKNHPVKLLQVIIPSMLFTLFTTLHLSIYWGNLTIVYTINGTTTIYTCYSTVTCRVRLPLKKNVSLSSL